VDLSKAKYAQLQERDGRFVVVLFGVDGAEMGFGYKGPTLKRAELDLRYWKSKGLDVLPSGSVLPRGS
jgi:hypothetical protein